MKVQKLNDLLLVVFCLIACFQLAGGCFALKSGYIWQGLSCILLSFYIVLFIHSFMISSKLNNKFERGKQDRIREKIMICAILILPLGGLSFEKGDKWLGIGLLLFSCYIMIFTHALMITSAINTKVESEGRQGEEKSSDKQEKADG